ncbi:MAG: hypothetical protein Kow0026_14850 [Oricola sp.]
MDEGMKRSGGNRCWPAGDRIALAGLVAAALAPAPAMAGSASYQDAFERRVSDPGGSGTLERFAVEAARQGQYDQALSTLEEALLRNPDDLQARLALARLYFQIGSYDLAAAHLDQAALTPGFDQYAREVAALRARIERGVAGVETELAVSAGGAYESAGVAQVFVPDDGKALFSPYSLIEGRITRRLDTASRDELRLGGTAQYDVSVADTDFGGELEDFRHYKVRGEATFSKGLPDIIDTLRLDLSGYGLAENYGEGRTLQELGAEAALSFQPTVESRITAHAGYGWLGNSQDLYGDTRVRYGLKGDVRVMPGVALGGHVSGYTEWGTAPLNFATGSAAYTAHGIEAGASVAHLLHVFADGRSWVQEAGANYSHERILDYGSLSGGTASMADRDRWEIFWNHTVQIVTRTELDFGVSYGEDRITGTPFGALNRSSHAWSVKAGLTYRFN